MKVCGEVRWGWARLSGDELLAGEGGGLMLACPCKVHDAFFVSHPPFHCPQHDVKPAILVKRQLRSSRWSLHRRRQTEV